MQALRDFFDLLNIVVRGWNMATIRREMGHLRLVPRQRGDGAIRLRSTALPGYRPSLPDAGPTAIVIPCVDS